MSATQTPTAEQLAEARRKKLANEVYLPVFMHTLSQYGERFVPKTAGEIESAMRQAAALRQIHDNQQASQPNVFDVGERKLAAAMSRANPNHAYADPAIADFARQVLNDQGILEAAAAFVPQ